MIKESELGLMCTGVIIGTFLFEDIANISMWVVSICSSIISVILWEVVDKILENNYV